MFKVVFNKYVAIFIIMHIARQIVGEQLNMRSFKIMSLVPTPQIGTVYVEISGRQRRDNCKLKMLIINNKTPVCIVPIGSGL